MRSPLRAAALIACLAVLVADAHADRPVEERTPDLPTFDPRLVAVEPETPLGQARAALREGDAARALSIAKPRSLTAPAPGSSELADHGRRLFLAAQAATALGRVQEASQLLGALSALDHPLARWARLDRAVLLETVSPAVAAADAAAVADEWPGGPRARLVEGRSLLRAGRIADGVEKLRALVAEAGPDRAAAGAALPLARYLGALSHPEDLVEAHQLCRRVELLEPLTDAASEAVALAAAIRGNLPDDEAARLSVVTEEESRRGRHALEQALGAGRGLELDLASLPDDELRCVARLERGRALLRRRERDRCAAELEQVAADCTSPEVRAQAHFIAGRAHALVGRFGEAIAQYEAVERIAPLHRLADDALYRAALAAAANGDGEGFRARLVALPGRYPEGDMRGEARFLVAFDAYVRGDRAAAHRELERLLGEGPRERDEDVIGRARYWHARVLAALGRDDDAARGYERVVREHGLSYYGQRAVERLRTIDGGRANALLASLRGEDERLLFTMRPEYETAAFDRAVELFAVGSYERAREELAWVGLFGDDAPFEQVALAAALHHHAGAVAEAGRILRPRIAELFAERPSGRWQHVYRLAFPDAFAPLVERAAEESNVSPHLVRAVAREESGFEPSARSMADARGLLQLLEPTARALAKKLGMRLDRRTLHEPATNLRLGAKHLSEILARGGAHEGLVPPSYNAGEGAVGRWLRERAGRPFDEWVEAIPYEETRRYTKRVLQSYGVYAWLGGAPLPELPLDVP